MPNSQSVYRERVLNALESVDVALEAIQASQSTIADASAGFDITYVFPAVDFGDGWTEDIQSPAGFRGTVKAYSIYNVTEALTATTTGGIINVGIQGGDADAYAVGSEIAALAIDAAVTQIPTAGVVGTIPVAEDILVTGVAATGGTPAGICTVALTISYYV
jgi:hypothetical protein